MSLLAIALTLAASADAAPPPAISAQPVCRKPELRTVDAMDASRARPLASEPPADHIHAVLRFDERGCLDPIVIDRNVGAPRR